MGRLEGPSQIQGFARSDGGLRRLGSKVVAAVRVSAVWVAVVCHRTVEREGRLGPAVKR